MSANSDVLVFIGRLRTDEWFTNWWVGMDANEYPVFYLRDSWGNDAILTGSTSLANGVWHQVVAVRDGVQNKNKLYIDGVKISEISVTYPHSFSVDANDSIPVNLGWFNSGSGHRFTGQMDEVALFNRALTDANVTSFYNSRNPVGHCAPGNYAPIITSEPETETLEKDLYEYTFVTSDFDAGDLLFLSAPVLPSWLEFTHTLGQRTALISGTPENEDVGDTTVTLRVSDGDITKNQTFTLTVINVNDNPVVNSTPSTSVDEGGSYSYTLIVSDADGDDLDITVPVLPDWLVWDEGSLTLSGLPENDDVGNHNVTISITDGVATVPHSFVITVNNVNMVPVITGQIPLSVSNSSTLTLAVNYFTVEDNDNDFPEHFTLTVFPGANYTLSGATITPSAGFLGTLYVGVKVSDLESTSDLYNATVTVVSGNVSPVIVGQTPLSVHNNSTLNLTLGNFTVVDPDNSYPADFTLNVSPGNHYSVSGTTITPEAAYLGNINVGVQVNDGVAASAVYYALVEVLGPVAVGDIETGDLVMVYPNPATEVVHFKFDEQVNIGMLEIYSIIGNLVMKVPVASDLVAIDVTDLNKGAFVYRVVAGEKVIVGTFTISEN